MQTSRMDIYEAFLPTDLKCVFWSHALIYWAGHILTLCSSSITNLINQVAKTIFDKFNPSSSPEPVPLSKRKFKKEDFNQSSSTDEEDWNFSLLFGCSEDSTIKSSASIPKDSLLEKEEDDKLIVETPISSKIPKQEDAGTEKPIIIANSTPKITKKLEEELQDSTDSKTPIRPKFTKFKRMRKKRDESNSEAEKESKTVSTSNKKDTDKTDTDVKSASKTIFEPKSQPKSNLTPKPTIDKVKKTKPVFIDNQGKGNCQLLSILKGLELQYPDLLKDQRKGQTGNLTSQKLREMGVSLARQQIDTYGEYVEDILGYLDSDRKDFNRAQINPVERNMNRERTAIERRYKSHKNSQLYEKQKKAHFEKYKKQIDNLEKNFIITTDKDFLDFIEKDGVQCSTLHLFTLSILLKLPIYVKEEKGIKGHDLQMFNPTESTKEPIYLYRVGNRHYKYMFYPKS